MAFGFIIGRSGRIRTDNLSDMSRLRHIIAPRSETGAAPVFETVPTPPLYGEVQSHSGTGGIRSW